ncbi:MAG TPA: hypothetical protein PK812_02610 [Beijerinckiaceae bacterium]|nr:hypothetical protein [Beijerinckiaceae bacterium]
MTRYALAALFVLGHLAPGFAQAPAPSDGTATASYIRAKPEQMLEVYPREVVTRVFSNEFTEARRSKVMSTIQGAPGVNCPERPNVVAYAVIPFKLGKDQTTWIERYAVGCDKAIGRNFLVILEPAGVKLLELVRGATRTDPFLQRDLGGPVGGIAQSRRPQGCQSHIIADTAITQQPPQGGGPWVEKWDIAACDHRSSIEITFTPSAQGGTTWNIKP